MTSSVEKRPNYARRFLWFAGAIVLAGILYTAGWFYAAALLVDRVEASVAAVNRDGRRASCENPEARGYPFRLGLFCRSVMFEDARGGLGFRARQLRSAAQIYAPYHVVGELEGPAMLAAPGLNALDLDWASLRASLRVASPLPERVSIAGGDLAVRLDEPGGGQPVLARADAFEIHMRPSGDDLDVAARFTGLAFAAELTGSDPLGALDGVVDVSITDGALLDGAGPSLRGRSGTIRDVTLSIDGSAFAAVAGPVSVDALGLVDAELQVTLHDPRAIADVLATLIPEASHEIELSLTALAAMGDAPVLPLRIVQGDMRLGFMSLGSIPPL